MQFTTFLAASVAVTGALAGVGYEAPAPEPEYTTTTSCSKSVVPEYETTSAPVYEPTDSPEPTDYGCSDVVYTSYSTYENPADYAVYTSTYYSTSKCPEVVPVPTYVPPAKNCTTSSAYEVPVDYATPTDYATPEPTDYATEEPETYTKTYYTTVCPGKAYCYGTTVTSTYCPATETHVPSYVPEHPTKSYEHPVPTYEPVPPPTYTKPAYNETVPPPPSYTGAASSNTISFGAAAFAGLVALFVAA